MKRFIFSGSGLKKRQAFRCLGNSITNERGVALVLAMGMLTLMSIIGAMALSTSSTEIGLSGNYKTSQLAFYSAQRAVEYAMTNGDIYSTIGTDSIDLEAGNHPANIAGGTDEAMGLVVDGQDNLVSFQAAGNLPPGSGSDPTYFEARYYLVNVTGQGPNNSVARVEAQIGRIVPK
jgi:hypothetical protein